MSQEYSKKNDLKSLLSDKIKKRELNEKRISKRKKFIMDLNKQHSSQKLYSKNICHTCKFDKAEPYSIKHGYYQSNEKISAGDNSNSIKSQVNMSYYINIGLFIIASVFSAYIFMISISTPYNLIFTILVLSPFIIKIYLKVNKYRGET